MSLLPYLPMQHGSGFPAVNGDSKLDLIDPLVPPHLEAPSTPIGPHELGTFTSEFGMYVKLARRLASVTSYMTHLCSPAVLQVELAVV